MVTTDVLNRMEHIGETVIAEEVVNPAQTASVQAMVESANVAVQLQSGNCSDGLLENPTDPNPSQLASMLPFLHGAFPAMTNQTIQTPLEGIVYSEDLPHASTTNVTLAQSTAVLPHHNLPESTLSLHNIQVLPEDVEYWKNLSQFYPCNASNSAPAHNLSTFTQWPEPNMNSQAQTKGFSEGLPHTYKNNSTNPAPPFPPNQQQAFPSWPEQHNFQVQQSDRYWDGALRSHPPYSLTISSMYQGIQSQDGAMLQSHVLSAGYACERQVRKMYNPSDCCFKS